MRGLTSYSGVGAISKLMKNDKSYIRSHSGSDAEHPWDSSGDELFGTNGKNVKSLNDAAELLKAAETTTSNLISHEVEFSYKLSLVLKLKTWCDI